MLRGMAWAAVLRRLDAYERLARLDKPVGWLLLLWPTLWALWLASEGWPRPEHFAIFVLGVILMRSSGCAINDWADRNFDPHVERTRTRPLAAGEITPGEAIAVGVFFALCAFALVLFLSRLAILLSFVALAIAWSYPFAKRFFVLPQAWLGVAFGFGIPMAYAAVQGRLPAECGLLLAANVCYSLGYDTEYAMVDRDDDAKLGLRTSALLFGRWDTVAVMASYAGMLALLALLGLARGFGLAYWAGLAAAALAAAAHWPMIRTRSREGCFRAFRHANWIGAAVLAGIVVELA